MLLEPLKRYPGWLCRTIRIFLLSLGAAATIAFGQILARLHGDQFAWLGSVQRFAHMRGVRRMLTFLPLVPAIDAEWAERSH